MSEVFKGAAQGPKLTIRELGGEKDGIGMQIAGAAQFSRGEDVVVTLGPRNADGTYDVRGLMMAKYSLEKDEAGNEYLNGPGLDSHAHDDDDGRLDFAFAQVVTAGFAGSNRVASGRENRA